MSHRGASADARPRVPPRILPAIVLAQLAGSATWFATNGVMAQLQRDWALPDAALGWSTSAVQAGFILGTLVFAVLAVADRFSARWVFVACALAGAAANASLLVLPPGLGWLLAARVLVGFTLAGVYPVGMKLASSWYERGLGAALGLLVGALALGTALPHGLRAAGVNWPWQQVIVAVSLTSVLGAVIIGALVPVGPFARPAARMDLRALAAIWMQRDLRASAFGYFGHMWELYAFLVAVPGLLAAYLESDVTPGVSALAFATIAAGFVGSALGGLVALRAGSARVAAAQLATSGCCALLAPAMMHAPPLVFLAWMLVWGATVVGDSPQFSALTALNAPREFVGSVLTFVNCIGFAITIVSITLVGELSRTQPLAAVVPWLAIGPALGLAMVWPLVRRGQ